MDQLLSFLVVIGILVFVHELGHFLAARWTGMRADVFAIGMGPRMLGWNRRTGFTFGPLPADLELEGDTDYRICWLPIGGYVKIIGMVDESFDTEFANRAPAPYEFRSKNALQKAFVLSAGVIMNLLLAFAVFTYVRVAYGGTEMRTTTIGFVEPGSVAAESALQRGDVIERVNGVAVGTWDQVLEQVGRASGADEITLNLARDGRTVVRKLSSSDVLHAISTRKEGAGLQRIGIEPMGIRVVAGPVTTFGPAGRAGLKEKDEILAIDSTPMFSPIQLTKYVRSHAGQQITLHVERETGTMPIPVTVGKDSLIQFVPIMKYIGPERYREFGVVESAGLAIDEIWSTSENIVVSVANVIQGKLAFSQSFGGPKRIAEMSAQAFSISIEVSLRLLALISISLAVLNLLPLPGLDGGHLVFVGVEAILRREIPTQIKIRIQQVGVFLLIGLMLLVIYFDFTR